MNCLEFHRQKLADPRRLSGAAQAHLRDCPGCMAFARSVDESERDLERALTTPVPEGLAERVILRQRGEGRSAWRAWALAAGIVVAAGVGYLNGSSPNQFARLAIQHAAGEPESFTTLYQTEPAKIGEALRSVGATLKEPIGRVRYVKLCPLEDGSTGWHIVFETQDGLATLILVPGKQARATEIATAQGWSSLVRPMASGYYAVVTASPEATARVDGVVSSRIAWRT